MSSSAENLAYMANQIARNLAAQGEAEAIAQTLGHIRDFWDPRMKAAILAADETTLCPIARAAVRQLGGTGDATVLQGP